MSEKGGVRGAVWVADLSSHGEADEVVRRGRAALVPSVGHCSYVEANTIGGLGRHSATFLFLFLFLFIFIFLFSFI